MLDEPQSFGRYHIIRLINTGGMGKVYLAEDTLIDRQVVIKVISEQGQATSEASRLFIREARAIARLNHPHILPLFDYGEEKGPKGTSRTYMVVPYCPDGSLYDWLQQRLSTHLPTPEDVAYLLKQAADALQYAHNHDIIHQDVKPHNFLIRNVSHTALPDLLLTDFGVAKIIQQDVESSFSIRGTPAYMAPEQWMGYSEQASDQYGLAATTYQLLTGNMVFPKGPMLYQHINDLPQAPSLFNKQISPHVDQVILRGLAKKPEERYPSVNAFATAFQEAVSKKSSPLLSTHQEHKPHHDHDLKATLTLKASEAREGISKTLILPDGKRSTVVVPAGTSDGQILRLEGLGEPDSTGGAGALILTILISAETNSETQPLLSPPNTLHLAIAGPMAPVDKQQDAERQLFAAERTEPLPIPKKKRSPVKISILTIVSLIIASSLTAYYFGYVNPIQDNSTNATQTALAGNKNTTPQDSPTASLTSTIVAATQTARALSTIQAMTPTTKPTVLIPVTNPYTKTMPKLVLNDPLTANPNHIWAESSEEQGASTCSFHDNSYYAYEQNLNRFADCAGPAYQDFTMEVQITFVHGDCGGIMFRASINTIYYYFRVCQSDANYSLIYYPDNLPKDKVILAYGPSELLHKGLHITNTLAIVASGPSLQVFINGHQEGKTLTSPKDAQDQGYVALAASAPYTPTDVFFNNVHVWTP